MRKFDGQVEFEVRWLPFQLDPGAPGGVGVNKFEKYRERFGAKIYFGRAMLWAVGKLYGITFSMGGNTGNTYDSHRLVSLSAKQGKQDMLVEHLFQSYFEQEECPSDHAVLLKVAERAGLSGVEEMLTGDAERSDVDRELNECRRKGIHMVPHFIIEDTYNESGAKTSGTFQTIFRQILNAA